jgi:DNA-binding CsgD family transcriptional regulator/N-acetylneuraminic acid mutarotase
MPETNELSEREREILYLVATGASNKVIASTLSISLNTVKVHLKNIFAKIGVSSRTEAAMYAVNSGLLTPDSNGQILNQPMEAENQQFEDSIGKSIQTTTGFHRWTRRVLWIAIGSLIVLVGLGLILRPFSPQQVSGQQTAPAVGASLPRWQTKSPMPTGRFGLGVAVYDGQIYAIAGETEKGVSALVERYNPETDEWVNLQKKPTAVKDVSAAVVGGKIFVPGGILTDGNVSDNLEIYNPADDSWESGKPLPVPLSGYALASYEGNLYVFGGWDGKQEVSSVYVYNPDLDLWGERTPMPTARAYAGAAIAIGRIYIMGGESYGNLLSVNEVYQPDLDEGIGEAWNQAASMPEPRSMMGVAGIADIIHVIGGQRSPDEFTSLGYIPENDAWQPIETFDGIGSQLGVAGLGEFLYVIGGKIDHRPVDTTLAYRAIYTVSIPVIINNQP